MHLESTHENQASFPLPSKPCYRSSAWGIRGVALTKIPQGTLQLPSDLTLLLVPTASQES
jgi:hypothetical protein